MSSFSAWLAACPFPLAGWFDTNDRSANALSMVLGEITALRGQLPQDVETVSTADLILRGLYHHQSDQLESAVLSWAISAAAFGAFLGTSSRLCAVVACGFACRAVFMYNRYSRLCGYVAYLRKSKNKTTQVNCNAANGYSHQPPREGVSSQIDT